MSPNKRILKDEDFPKIILNESEDYMVVNKPPGLSTLEDRSSDQNLLAIARAYHSEAKVCHRLDKDTSGILVIAKNLDFYKYFAHLLESREVVKVYHGLVPGIHDYDELELDKPILVSTNKSRVDVRKGKTSLTLVSTVEQYSRHTLLACMPFTGRTHQIRVHLQDLGHPLIGDQKYGGEDIFLSQIKRNYKIGKDKVETPLIARFALHAAMIAFSDNNGEKVKFSAPYPKDFSVLLKQLSKNT